MTFLDCRFKHFLVVPDAQKRKNFQRIASEFIKKRCAELGTERRETRASVAQPKQPFFNIMFDRTHTLANSCDGGPLSPLDREIDMYSDDPTVNSTSGLDFFKCSQSKYPQLAKLACQLFCVPATSVPAECMFSRAGRVAESSANRTSLALFSPNNLGKILFLRENL